MRKLNATFLALLFFSLFSGVAFADRQIEVKDGKVTLNVDWQMVGDKKSRLDSKQKDKFKHSFEEDLNSSLAALSKKVKQPEVVNAVKMANDKNSGISMGQIMKLDSLWRSQAEVNPIITKLLDEDCNNELIQLQKENQEFAEVFVTDKQGLNVCQTNKTSDYYQGDEAWWKNSKGTKPSHGRLEYDQSAETFAISIYVPVIDEETNKVIGLSKGVVRKKFGS